MSDTSTLEALVQALRRLPGVGVKSASRMAFHLLQNDREGAELLSRALHEASSRVRHCERCHTFTESAVCETCLDAGRDVARLCVVETPADQAALELVTISLKFRCWFVKNQDIHKSMILKGMLSELRLPLDLMLELLNIVLTKDHGKRWIYILNGVLHYIFHGFVRWDTD